MNFSNLIASSDFISYSPSLLVNGSSRAQNVFGGILSLLVVSITAASAYFFTSDLLLRRNPLVNFNKYYKVNETFIMSKNTFFVALAIRRNDSSDFDDPKTIYEVKGLRYHYENIQNPDGTYESVLREPTDVPLAPCTKEDVAPYVDLQNIPYDKYMCLSPEASVEMFNPLGYSGSNAYLNIYFRPCQDDVAAKGGYKCAPKEVIDAELNESMMWARMDNYFVEHTSFLEPVKKYIKNIFYQNKIDIYNRTYVNFGLLTYETDIGFIFESKRFEEYFAYQSDSYRNYTMTEESKAVKKTFHQLTLTFGRNGLHDKYIRVYRKVQNTLADIGGFSKGCLIIATVLNYLLSKSFILHLIFDKSLFIFAGLKGTSATKSKTLSSIATSMVAFDKEQSGTRKIRTSVLDQNTVPVKVGNIDLRKVTFFPYSYFRGVLCCKKSKNDKKIAKLVEKFYYHCLDVRTLIKTTQRVNLLKNFVLTNKERDLFDRLGFLVDLSYSEINWTSSTEEINGLITFLRANKVESSIVERFLKGNSIEKISQNYVGNSENS